MTEPAERDRGALYSEFMEEFSRAVTKEDVVALVKKHSPKAGYKNVARWMIGRPPKEKSEA